MNPISNSNMSNLLARITQFLRPSQKTARFAKERLQIIISHERAERDKPDYLTLLQQDLLEVISKYVPVNKEAIRVELERKDGCSVLELNVMLPDLADAKA